MYNALIHPDVPIDIDYNNKLLKLKIPLQTKVYAWYLHKGVILTKDNLAKQNWHGSKKYVFCHKDETIKHFFPMLFRQIYMVSYQSSFDLMSAT
jgi:hypothetical protein